MGRNHAQLKLISEENEVVFLEFPQQSETRFSEHQYKVYDHFYKMYPILVIKVKRDVESGEISNSIDSEDLLEKHLFQASLILNLAFMREISHLLTRCSKEFQRFDCLPYHNMLHFEILIERLDKANTSFKRSEVPSIEPLSEVKRMKSHRLWHDFETCVKNIRSDKKFQGSKLLLPSERGRITRSGTVFACERDSYVKLIDKSFESYSQYIELLSSKLKCRFTPWPVWVTLVNDCFNFSSEKNCEQQQKSLELLMEEPSGVVPLKIQEKERIKAEYVTLQHFAKDVEINLLKKKSKFHQEELWYELLSTEEYYKNCLNINEFALKFLTRTFNECTVESQVSAISQIETTSRRLSHEHAQKLAFISKNGPHPLVAMNVVEEALNLYFKGKPWHFALSSSKYYTSKAVDSVFKEVKDMPNLLA